MRDRFDRKPQVQPAAKASVVLPAIDDRTTLGALDLSKRLSKTKYDSQLEKWQGRLNLLSREPKFKRMSVTILFEGPDAPGKGGAIRRITGALDARQYQGIPIAAPIEEEHAQPYLWRFWHHLPRRGRSAIYDRSWYGRVLVERVERFCAEADWMRAYSGINDFEEQLALNHKTALRCAMGDRARGATGWDKFDRAARKAKVVRVASGLAQESWNKLRPIIEQFYEQSNPGVKAPIEHKVDYFLKINSEGTLEQVTSLLTNGETNEQL